MVTHEFVIRLPLLPALRWSLVLALLIAAPTPSSTADVSTLTSFYPNPAGTFESDNPFIHSLVTTGDAWIGRDAGHVELGSEGDNHAQVIVGAAPKLPGWCDSQPQAAGCQTAQLAVTGPGAIRIDGCIRLLNTANANKKAYRCRWSRNIPPEF